jgi:hypothetical protein
MTEEIGRLWQAGENMKKEGELLEALLLFHRAKVMLITESNTVFSSNGK